MASDIKISEMVNVVNVVNTKRGKSEFYQIVADYVINIINNRDLNKKKN